MCLLATYMSSQEKDPKKDLLLIKKKCFPKFSFLSSLYILDINPLSDLSFTNIFSYSAVCFSILLIVSFAEQSIFQLIKFNGTPLPVLLPGKSHGWRSLVGCNPWGRQSRTRLSDFTFTFHFHSLEKEMAIHSSVLARRIPGTGKPGELPSMGSHRVGHD